MTGAVKVFGVARVRRVGWAGLAGFALALAATGAPAQPEPPAPPPAVVSTPPVVMPAPSAAQLALALQTLKDADLEGLQPKAYLPADTTDAAAVMKGLVRYAHDVRVGRLALGDFPELWTVRPAPYDPTPGLAKALADDRLQAWLDAQRPPYAGYHGLKRGLARYRAIAAKGGWKTLPSGKPMALHSTDPRVPALRERLAAEDPLAPATGPAKFDEPLQEAVVRAQRRYGVNPDGVVGPEVLRHLNKPVGQRVLQTLANMERWRWLPPEMPATRVQANSGAAVVTLFREDRPVLSMKAVSGRPGDETPMLASAIHSVVINPPWNVPTSIATKELWPKQRANPGYFAANDYLVIDNPDGTQRIQQKAGPKAALGRFKFDFANPFSVYLHDTPSRAGFDRFARNASHGCVRLENAQGMAEALLEGDPKWTKEAIQAQIDAGKTVRVPLSEKVPVFILYWTAFAGSDGTMNFRADPYEWDRDLLVRVGVLDGSI